MKSTFEVKFFLDHADYSIFEIKRLDITSENPADIYFWLLLHKLNHTLERLTFSSMHAEGSIEIRSFKEGSLMFNQQEGGFIRQTASMISLKTQLPSEFPDAYQELVTAYLAHY